jgi:head-tail adaptor
MDSRTLDSRITIERKTSAQDPDYGTYEDAWVPITNGSRIPANAQDVLPSKSEATRNGIRIATQPTRIRIRFRTDVTGDMRVVIHGATDRICQIVSGPAEIGRREWLEMMVENYSS